MDTTEKDYDADAILAELRESLKKVGEPEVKSESNTIDFSSMTGASDYDYFSSDTITLSNTHYNNTIIGGGYTVGSGISATGGPYTIGSSNGTTFTYPNAVWQSTTASVHQDISGSINLNGENADVKVNGYSLSEAIRRLEERLNILHINPELEEEWAELKELGDKYRALEAKLKEQGEMWEKLKRMPPPDSLS